MKSYYPMTTAFPFYSSVPDTRIYHTHPRCRIAQGVALQYRVAGTGAGQRECPFCFLLGQFQLNKSSRGHPSGQGAGASSNAAPGRSL